MILSVSIGTLRDEQGGNWDHKISGFHGIQETFINEGYWTLGVLIIFHVFEVPSHHNSLVF